MNIGKKHDKIRQRNRFSHFTGKTGRNDKMSYEKRYNEIYAITALKYFWQGYQKGFIKWESPDWYNSRCDLGVEVSQALLPKDGQEESFLRSYLGKHKNQLPPDAFRRYGSRLYFYNDRLWALLNDGTDSVTPAEKIRARFQCKLQKLNKNYRRCETNTLYLFAHAEIKESVAKALSEELSRLQQPREFQFDIVFADCKSTLYAMNLRHGTMETIPIPEKAAEFLREKTEHLRHRLSDKPGTPYR